MLKIDNILNLIDKIKSDEFKEAAKKAVTTIKDKKTSLMRYTGKIGDLKHKLMIASKGIDQSNINLMKDYSDIAETISKSRSTADKIARVGRTKLKLNFKAGSISKSEFKQGISALKNSNKLKHAEITQNYFKAIQDSITKNRNSNKKIVNYIINLKDQLDIAKKSRSKNILIGIGIAIAVLSVIAIGSKVYAMIMKKLKSPCRNIDDKDEKTSCEIYSEIDSLQAQIIILKHQSVKCELSEDPVECNQKVDKQIESIKSKIDKLHSRLDE